MRNANAAELRASHESSIQRELATFLRDVYEYSPPDAGDVPRWDPPGEVDTAGKHAFERFDADGLPEDEQALAASVYYAERYRQALDLADALRELASDLHDKLEAIEAAAHDAGELSSRAHQLRCDLESWGLPLPDSRKA
jgi:hypothetical protein